MDKNKNMIVPDLSDGTSRALRLRIPHTLCQPSRPYLLSCDLPDGIQWTPHSGRRFEKSWVTIGPQTAPCKRARWHNVLNAI
jgi:hypothetical protein